MRYEKAKAEAICFDGMELFMGTSSQQSSILSQISDCTGIKFTNSNTFECTTHQGGGSEMFEIDGHYFVFSGNAQNRTWTCAGF